MIDLFSAFDAPPIARSDDPETSKIAAANVTRSGNRKRHAELILAAVIANPGSTSGELAVISGVERVETSRRLSDLNNAARVYSNGKRTCRECGTAMMCWYATGHRVQPA